MTQKFFANASASLELLSRFNRAMNEVKRLRRQRRTLATALRTTLVRLRGALTLVHSLEIDVLNLQARNAQHRREVSRLQEVCDHLRHEVQEERRISRELLDDMARDLSAAREEALLASMLRRDMAA